MLHVELTKWTCSDEKSADSGVRPLGSYCTQVDGPRRSMAPTHSSSPTDSTARETDCLARHKLCYERGPACFPDL